MMEDVVDVPEGMMRILVLEDAANRKLVHMYLTSKHPNVHHTSLRSSLFESERALYQKCMNCDSKRLIKFTYHYGDLPNNMDECYTGYCSACNSEKLYEPNYDGWDNNILAYSNNIIAIGNYFSKYSVRPDFHKKGDISDKDVLAVLNKTYLIKAPQPNLKKRSTLMTYIDGEIKKARQHMSN